MYNLIITYVNILHDKIDNFTTKDGEIFFITVH